MLELLAKVRISERKSKLVFEFSQRTKVPKRFIVKVRISERKSKLVFEFSQRTEVPEGTTQRTDMRTEHQTCKYFTKTFGHLTEKQ